MIADTQYDYIIVEENSASRVLESLLTEDIEHKVLVLEADGSDESIFIQVSTALSHPMNIAKYEGAFITGESLI